MVTFPTLRVFPLGCINYILFLEFPSSSLVLKILKDAYDAGKKFKVVVVDSRPKFEGTLFLSVARLSVRQILLHIRNVNF